MSAEQDEEIGCLFWLGLVTLTCGIGITAGWAWALIAVGTVLISIFIVYVVVKS